MNEIITLVYKKRTLVSGIEQEKELKKQVFAEAKSVGRTEFYKALQAGLNASVVFKVYTSEWCMAEFIEWNGTRFKVIRAYMNGVDYTEITCSEEL